MSLSGVLRELLENKKNAAIDVTMEFPSTYAARLGVKRSAESAVERLTLEYRKALLESAAFMVVVGGARNSFSEIASGEDFGCFSVDPDDFYKDLVSKLDPSVFGKESTKNLFSIVNNVLQDKLIDLGISSTHYLAFSETYNLGAVTPKELVPLIRRAFNDQVGSEVVGVNAIYSIVDKAIENGHTAKVTPVILNTADEQLALDLNKNLRRQTNKVFLVVTGKASKELTSNPQAIVVKTVSKESVGEALETVRNKILL